MLGLGIPGWIFIGGLAGWIASKLMTDEQQGILLDIVVGVVGGLIEGVLLTILGVDVDGAGLWFSLFAFLGGAVILLLLVNLVAGRRSVR